MIINPTKVEILLAERNMSKATLAKLCGISRQNLSTLLRRGSCEPRTAGKLAAGLGIPVSEIVKES